MRALLLAIAIAFAGLALAQSPAKEANPVTEARLRMLADELRCLVCQNQTIADSNAALAEDLRKQIRAQIAEGRTDGEIRDYMVQRYGDFVLYRPPFKATTVALWLGPVVLLAGGVLAAFIVVRRRTKRTQPETAPKRRAELEKLLDEKG